MTIEIEGLTRADKLAIQDMMALWMTLGEQGASRWTAFFADGDGAFRPKITVDGEPPQRYLDGSHPKEHWINVGIKTADGTYEDESIYMMDSDMIAANEREAGR